jgi:glycosyltransferase involved in cell wall biosynthesis
MTISKAGEKDHPMKVDFSVSVIIPCYNEATSICGVVADILQRYPDFEVIVVDDGSTDGSDQVAIQSGASVIRHPYNMGNGAAVKSGIRAARGDIVVLMDADGQHDSEDIAALIEFFPEFDMVVGARKGSQQASILRQFGNAVYNRLASYVAKFKIEDLTSGFRAVKRNVIRRFLYLLPNSYSYPTTSTLCILRSGLPLQYVSVQVHKRQKGKSQIRLFKDGIRFFMIIVKICTLFSPFRIFLPVSTAILLIGLLYYMYTFVVYHRFTNMSALFLSTSVIIFMIGLVSEQICQMVYRDSENES